MEYNFTQFLIKNEYKYYACVLILKSYFPAVKNPNGDVIMSNGHTNPVWV